MNNKILRKTGLALLFTLIGPLIYTTVRAQEVPLNQYGLGVVTTARQFRSSLYGHPEKMLLPLSGIQDLRLDLRYSGSNNFTNAPVYEDAPEETYLRRAPAKALDSAAKEMSAAGFGLLIFDAYRPYSVTEELWKRVRDDRYAADPAKGSGHNRGIAVDLTLYDLKTGQILSMPTGFDNFSDTAHQDFMALPDSIVAHRELLTRTMEKYGFLPLPTEWWHFSWPSPLQYELLDLSFYQVGRLAQKR